jgi:hypothetical protein
MNFIEYLDSLIESECFQLDLRKLELTNILKEAKQVGNIYHFTELKNLEPILRTNTIKVSGENTNDVIKFVSLTRNYKLPDTSIYFGNDYNVRFVLDGDKLSQNISITPFQDPNYEYKEESEEVVFRNIKVSKYIKQIDIKIPKGSLLDTNKITNICKKYNIKYNIVQRWGHRNE